VDGESERHMIENTCWPQGFMISILSPHYSQSFWKHSPRSNRGVICEEGVAAYQSDGSKLAASSREGRWWCKSVRQAQRRDPLCVVFSLGAGCLLLPVRVVARLPSPPIALSPGSQRLAVRRLSSSSSHLATTTHTITTTPITPRPSATTVSFLVFLLAIDLF
jgi:hypothetical protein